MVAVAQRARLQRRGVPLEWFTVTWNVVEAVVAITAGVVAGSVALVGFGIDSGIEVVAASALLWRFRTAGVDATAEEHGGAERRALYIVSGTFFVLAIYIGFEAVSALASGEKPDTSRVGVVLAVVSMIVMPILAYAKHRSGQALGSRALEADAVETWVCAYLSLALLAGVGLNAAFGWWWADPVGALAMLPVIIWQGGKPWKKRETTTIDPSARLEDIQRARSTFDCAVLFSPFPVGVMESDSGPGGAKALRH
jgi:cation diffusion facilitator family transporter